MLWWICILLCIQVHGLLESEIGVADWHRSYIGVPIAVFSSIEGDIIAVSRVAVARLVHSDGAIQWRQHVASPIVHANMVQNCKIIDLF